MDQSYRFIYQEWDVMREKQIEREEKIERVVSSLPSKVNFAMQLQQARIRQRITIHDLATQTNIPIQHITAFETGAEVPSDNMMQRLRAILCLK